MNTIAGPLPMQTLFPTFASPLAAATELSSDGMISLAVVAAVFGVMQWRQQISVDLLFLGGLALVTLAGVLPPDKALEGFASNAVILIAALFAAASALRNTGALDWIGNRLLGSAETERAAIMRLAVAVAPTSAGDAGLPRPGCNSSACIRVPASVDAALAKAGEQLRHSDSGKRHCRRSHCAWRPYIPRLDIREP